MAGGGGLRRNLQAYEALVPLLLGGLLMLLYHLDLELLGSKAAVYPMAYLPFIVFCGLISR